MSEIPAMQPNLKTDRRRDHALRRALATPPKKHKDEGGKTPPKSKRDDAKDRS